MKAFLVGLVSSIALFLLAGIGILLLPLLLVLTLVLRIAVGLVLILLAIWLFGKFILYIWKEMNKKSQI